MEVLSPIHRFHRLSREFPVEAGMRFFPPVSLAPAVDVITISSGDACCHLLVTGGASLLVNCLGDLSPSDFLQAGYPLPGEIWHTHIDDRLAGEGDRFSAAIRLPGPFAEAARASDRYRRDARTAWDRPQDWMHTFGREKYGVAGSVVLDPLAAPLANFDVFEAGETLHWQGLAFDVVDFSVRHFHAVGFALKTGGETLALFSGELMDADGHLPDAHGFEAQYTSPPWPKVAATLREAAALDPRWLCPSFGLPVREPASLLNALAGRIDRLSKTPPPEDSFSVPATKPAMFGRYFDHGDSVYQIANYGNVILLINEEGFGLMIDPGPCDFENPRRREEFLADLEKFETGAGLKAIDLVLVTHFHGDHYDFWPLVRERYPQARLAAWRPVADVIAQPETYPYPCLLPWYKAGWDKCPVDIPTSRREPLLWHNTAIHTVHLPGHCLVHAGYWLDWRGRRILFSGDSIQTRGEVDNLQLILCNHTIPGTPEGHGQAYLNVIPLGITLNLGGHSSRFSPCTELYRASERNIAAATADLQELFGAKEPGKIYLRPRLRSAAERVRRLITES